MLPTRLLRPQQDEADNKRQTGDGGKNQQQSASRKRHGCYGSFQVRHHNADDAAILVHILIYRACHLRGVLPTTELFCFFK